MPEPHQPDRAAVGGVEAPEQFHPARFRQLRQPRQPGGVRFSGVKGGGIGKRGSIDIVVDRDMGQQMLKRLVIHGFDLVKKRSGVNKRRHLAGRGQHGFDGRLRVLGEIRRLPPAKCAHPVGRANKRCQHVLQNTHMRVSRAPINIPGAARDPV